jgi:hypothetical protein
VVARYRGTVKRLYFRGDRPSLPPEIYEFLEAEGVGHMIRLPANPVLQDNIGYLLKRPVGRPPHEVRRYYASFGCEAQSWNRPRVLWLGSNGMRASFTRGSGSSSQTWRGPPSAELLRLYVEMISSCHSGQRQSDAILQWMYLFVQPVQHVCWDAASPLLQISLQ